MRIDELTKAVEATINETQAALQIMYNALNQGQQIQIIKNEAVKALFDRYNVSY